MDLPHPWALLASSQINMRKIDGWQTLATKLIDQPIDLAASSDSVTVLAITPRDPNHSPDDTRIRFVATYIEDCGRREFCGDFYALHGGVATASVLAFIFAGQLISPLQAQDVDSPAAGWPYPGRSKHHIFSGIVPAGGRGSEEDAVTCRN